MKFQEDFGIENESVNLVWHSQANGPLMDLVKNLLKEKKKNRATGFAPWDEGGAWRADYEGHPVNHGVDAQTRG